MNENIKWYKCPICGNIIELIDGDIKYIQCCKREMDLLTANTEDAAHEKHIPVYEKKEEEIIVKVGEIEHPMEEAHHIMWVAQVIEDKVTKVACKPNQKIEIKFPYKKGASLYAYCSTHGLWKSTVK